jgi:REP element-mobilizing transposase RayT
MHIRIPSTSFASSVLQLLRLLDEIKAAASRVLNEKYGVRPWWAVGGSCKYLWKRDYFENTVNYVRRQRDPNL